MMWILKKKQRRRGWYSCGLLPPLCVLSKATSVLHGSMLPCYQQWVPTWGHPRGQGQRPCEQAPGLTEPRHPWTGCYMKVFSCKGDGEWRSLEEPRFRSCETTLPSISNPGACWIAIVFKSTLKWELSLWNVCVPQLMGCSYHVGQLCEHLFCRHCYGCGHWTQWEPRSASPLF